MATWNLMVSVGYLWLFNTSDHHDPPRHNAPPHKIFTTGGRHKICNSVEFTVYHVIITVHIRVPFSHL